MKSFVVCRIPRAGLGNQLLTWAKAVAFGHRHGLEVLHWGWSVPSRTRVQRILQGNETWRSLMKGSPLVTVGWNAVRAFRCQRVVEPLLSFEPSAEDMICHFHLVPPWQDYFGDFRDQREHVLGELRATMRPGVWKSAEALPAPYVIANLRMGDFAVVTAGVDFSKVGQHRTPFTYFQNAIAGIRHFAGWNVPIHLVSDGTSEELAPLLEAVPGITLVPQRPALVNLLWMSKAKAIIASAGSTFSFWAGFMGESAVMHHPAHTPVPSRDASINARCYDGAAVEDWTQWPELLKSNLRAIIPHDEVTSGV